MGDLEIESISSGMRRSLLVASMSVILLAGLELIGWIWGWQLLAAGAFRYIPMAPSTAICFIVLSLSALFFPREDSSWPSLVGSISIILLVMVYCGLHIFQYWERTALHIEEFLFPNAGFLNGVPLARMSPVTGGLFLVSGGAMLLAFIRSSSDEEHYFLGNLGGLLGSIVAFSGFTILLGYAYGTPLLYGREVVPVAATTAAAFLFLGFAVVVLLRPDDIPLRYFLGLPVQRRLVRTFTPLVLISVLLQGAVDRIAPVFVDVNNALLSALLAGFVAILAVVATSKTASVVGNDIDQAEEALRQSEQTLRTLVDSNPESLFMMDTEGIVLVANEKVARRIGTTVSGLIGSSVYDFLPGELAEERKERIQEVIRTGKPVRFQDIRTGRTIDNHIQPVVDAHGVVVSLAVLGIDITNVKKAEEVQKRLSTAIEQSAEIVMITDADGVIQYVNPATERITGFSRSEIIGNNPRIFKSGEHSRDFYEQLWKTITAGDIWSGRIINRKKDGSLYYEDATISPVRDASGKIVSFVTVKRDVTEHLKLSRQLIQAQKMEAIGNLAGGVAHDFNNLLTVIQGYSELLLCDEGLKDKDKADLERINHAAQSGADLVRRLLMFSRKSEMKPRPMSLNQQITQTKALLSRTIPKTIYVELRLAEELPAIEADPVQIEQVLMNLSVNATDAMPDGGTLLIETQETMLGDEYLDSHFGVKSGSYALLSFSDTGEGIDKESLEHIFEPFFTTKSPGKGTGLGLAVVYGIVKQHGGHITCYSQPGIGTTFKIYLPLAKIQIEQRIQTANRKFPGGTETILLVDDEQGVRELGERILTRAGYTVLTAADGGEALNIFRKEEKTISLVILDLIMPEMDGHRCLQEILKVDQQAKVIVSSGYSPTGTPEKTSRSGAKGFVGKPYDMKQLLGTVREVLDQT